jgi:hypothetical protein
MEEKTLHDEVKDDIADAYVALLFKKSPRKSRSVN